MNPLPRLLALGLFIVLAALSVMLGATASQRARLSRSPSASATAAPAETAAARLAQLSQRLTFPVALTGVVLAVALVASLAMRPARPADSKPPFGPHGAEMGALARLAESSVAQGKELATERDERRRAEADAWLHQQLLNRSLEEQIRLGHDLHDGIIQSLYAAGLTIESARAVGKTDPDEADRRLERCREHLNQTIRDVRAYIAGLAPEHLRQASFADAVGALTRELGAGRNARFDLRIDDAATNQLTPEHAAEALQIAREGVSNSLRHGDASLVTVRLHQGDGEVCLLVQDDGRGFDPARASRGHGLDNVEARARRIGGQVRFESSPGAGTRMVFTLPLRKPV